MSSPSSFAPEEKKTPHAVPTSASKCLNSSWRRSKESLGLLSTVPRYLRDSSWRDRETTAASLFNTPSQYSKSLWFKTHSESPTTASVSPWNQSDQKSPQRPWYETHSESPTTASISPWDQSDSSSSHQPWSPWNKTVSNTASQIAALPGSRTGMLPHYGYSSTGQVTRGAESDQGDFRPRLQLQIPAGGEERSNGPRIALRDSTPLNLAAVPSAPQQASQPPNKRLISFQQGSLSEMTTSNTPGSNVPHRQQRGISRHTNEDSSTDSNPERVSQTDMASRIGGEGHADTQDMTSLSPQGSQISTSRGPHTTIATRTGFPLHADSFAARAQTNQMHDPFLPAIATQFHNIHQVDHSEHTIGPRSIARRPAHANSYARGGPARRSFANQIIEATHSNSRTWVHPRARLQVRWAEVYKNLKDMSLIKEGQESPVGAIILVGGGSFCVPKTFTDWIEHRTGFASDRAKEARQRLQAMGDHKQIRRHPDLPPAGEIAPITIMPFGGRQFRDGRSSVLASHTIWTPWTRRRSEGRESPKEERGHAEWPCSEEMKEEGNERNTSQYRRFLALPRRATNSSVAWKQLRVLPMLPFDEIWKLPSRETYYDQRAVTAPEEMEKMESMVGQDLIAAIDSKMDAHRD